MPGHGSGRRGHGNHGNVQAEGMQRLNAALTRLGEVVLKAPSPALAGLATPSSGEPRIDASPIRRLPDPLNGFIRDLPGMMKLALFSLERRDKRANDVIYHRLSEATVRVSSGSAGMATIDDYDLAIVAMSQLTDDTNRWRKGKRPKPGRVVRLHVGEVLTACRRGEGGNQRRLLREVSS